MALRSVKCQAAYPALCYFYYASGFLNLIDTFSSISITVAENPIPLIIPTFLHPLSSSRNLPPITLASLETLRELGFPRFIVTSMYFTCQLLPTSSSVQAVVT